MQLCSQPSPARPSYALGEPVELTKGAAFAGRIIRLALTSSIALGLVWWLAGATLEIPLILETSLAAGWVLMPLMLLASLRWPRVRYALVLPSSLVGLPLLVICARYLPDASLASTGWLLVTGGILLGSVLGIWFWFRWLPVPASLHDPFSRGRWLLVALHIALIVGGLALVGTSSL